MAYREFAYFYDELNEEADYDALFQYVKQQLDNHAVQQGVVVDLGCGTGDLTLMLTQAGYDMIGVDQSAEMLSVLREKADELELSDRLLLIQQDILELDLYGSIRAAVSTFDTFNHIGPSSQFEKAIERVSLFMEQGGVFVFDLNTPYKHREILANHVFEIEGPDAYCRWENTNDEAHQRVQIAIDVHYKETDEHFEEQFYEYTYPLEYAQEVLQRYGFAVEKVCDGETFGDLTQESQRYMITAIKQFTQMESE